MLPYIPALSKARLTSRKSKIPEQKLYVRPYEMCDNLPKKGASWVT
jgi:hypothetical protein